MSSSKLRVKFRPKSEIQTIFPPKIRWSPKKKRSSPKLRLVFRRFKRFFRPKSGGLQKKKKKNGLHRNWEWFFGRIRKFKQFFRPKSGGLQKKKQFSPKLRVIFRPNSEIQTFFLPKIRWSPKKKKRLRLIFDLRKNKKKVETELRLIFRPKSLVLGWWGGCIPPIPPP